MPKTSLSIIYISHIYIYIYIRIHINNNKANLSIDDYTFVVYIVLNIYNRLTDWKNV